MTIVSAARANEIVSRIQRGEERAAVKRIALAEVVKEYLAMQGNRGAAPKTIVKYTQVLNDFDQWYKERADGLAGSFSDRDFWAFSNWMSKKRKRRLAPKTVEDRLVIVKQLFKFGTKEKLLANNPIASVSIPTAPGTIQPCFAPDQVAALLAAATEWARAIFAMMAYTGLRFGEVRDLRWADILFNSGKKGVIIVQRGGSGPTTKNKKIRRIPIHSELHSILTMLPRNFDRVFTMPPSHHYPQGGCPLNERTLIQALKNLCAKCKFAEPNQYKLHTFRHAFCSMCARTNVSYKYALSWMGHSSSEILDLYYTMFDETAEIAMETIQYTNVQASAARKAG